MFVVIDNYDSFTYNLVQMIATLGVEVVVYRNDRPELEAIGSDGIDGLVISPGPGMPENAGRSMELVRRLSPRIPVLGVCLGHQALGAAFGAVICKAGRPMHGKKSMISHDGQGLYAGLPDPFEAGRYHSLVIEKESLPACFKVTATAGDDGEIMGIRHESLPLEGVQFHPESVLTANGKRMLRNFIEICGKG